MSDFVKLQFERLEPRLRAVVAEITRVQIVRFGAAPCWTPALNVYRYPDRFVVCVELAGISEQTISVQAEPRRLRLAGYRPRPNRRSKDKGRWRCLRWKSITAGSNGSCLCPIQIDPNRASAEKRDGWLWIQLPLNNVP